MSDDPFNQLPVDPAWLHKAAACAKRASEELQCMVLQVAAQENGKMHITVEGDMPGPLGEAFKSGGNPAFFFRLAMICAAMDDHDKTRARS